MSKVSKFLKKNQIAICAGLGIFGTVAAVGTSIPATIKAVRVIDKATADKGSELTFGEKVKLVWKFYIATVLATAGSVTANAIGGVKAVKRISSLATTVSSLAAAHEVYKEDIRKALGKEKYEEVRKQIAEEKTKNVADDGLPFDLNRHDGKLPCKDLQTGKWFWTTYEQLVDAKQIACEAVKNGFWHPLSDFSENMGVPSDEVGAMLSTVGFNEEPHIMILRDCFRAGGEFLTVDYDYDQERDSYGDIIRR